MRPLDPTEPLSELERSHSRRFGECRRRVGTKGQRIHGEDARVADARPHGSSTENVSHASGSPEAKPVSNHFWRCFALPCVHVSGST